MKNIIISTENTCDLSAELLGERGIMVANMHYRLDGVEYDGTEKFDSHEFYEAMRKGADTSTSMINEYDAEQYLAELSKQGKDIVHISFAGACSANVKSFVAAAKKLNEKQQNKIYVIDSLCESAGQGLLTVIADDLANEGKSAKEVFVAMENYKHKICHYFCVDNLKYLARGGRVSKVSAFIGNIINIKPVLHSDVEGALIPICKEITRKKSLERLVKYMESKYDGASDKVFIAHADCLPDAELVARLVVEKLGLTPQIFNLGPVIGSHSGPGTVALFFTAENRLK